MSKTKNATLPVGLTPEMEKRVISASERTGLPKNALARLAIEGAVEAVEQHQGRLVVPIRFEVKMVPSAKKGNEK